ncbi:MAG: hypothetical protein VX475_08905, partial [Myxococcota bacterium]|nr:hypothetical protein [Myxococcota bacterium]
MIEDMRSNLRDACEEAGISELEEVLLESEPYMSALESEIGALRDRIAVLRGALSEMESLQESSDFGAISAALLQYDGYPGECAAAWTSLDSHRSSTLQDAVEAMSALIGSDDFAAVTAATEKYEAYPDEAKDAWESLVEYCDEMVGTANVDLEELCESSDIVAIDEGLAKYASYGDAVDDAMSRLREHRASLESGVAAALEELSALSESDDFVAVSAAVDKYSGHASADVRSACGAVSSRRDTMIEDMRSNLRDACEEAGISELEEVLLESEPYMSTLESEIGALRDRIAVLRGALSEMESLQESSDFGAISAALLQYDGYPGECAAAWTSLDSHRSSALQ